MDPQTSPISQKANVHDTQKPTTHRMGFNILLVLNDLSKRSNILFQYLFRDVDYGKQYMEQYHFDDYKRDEYHDYNLVMATSTGMPTGGSVLRKKFKKLIEEKGLPDVVFHSLRHTSVTYKLKLNGGDVKAVQGDSGHAQVDMVTNVYSHIIDEDRKKNAQLFEEAFYGKKDLDPQLHVQEE